MNSEEGKMQRKLDPRLRRLIAAQSNMDMMATAHSRGEVTASTASITPSTEISTRVLLELNADSKPDLGSVDIKHIAGNIYTADVPIREMAQLADKRVVASVEAGRRWYPALETSLPETHADVVQQGDAAVGVAGRTGEGVIVGIIDIGLDYTLDDFRNGAESRVEFLWDQSLHPVAGEQAPGKFQYGVEYSRSDIENALGNANPFSVVRHRAEPASHGTHVAGIAAGNGRSSDAAFPAGRHVGAAPNAKIIFVHPRIEHSIATFTDSSNVVDAIAYIFEKADELGLPCVINMSLGQNGGSHDGESLVERAIDRLLEQSGRAFVSAAGNEHIWRGHASGNLDAGTSRTLRWKVGGGMPVPGGATGFGRDRTPSEMEIWFSSRDRFRVTVTDPAGNATRAVEPDGHPLFEQINGSTQIFIDSERFTVFNGDSRIYIQIEPIAFSGEVMPGAWSVTLDALETDTGKFNAWIERDARDRNNNFADQSFFVGGDFDPVSTLGTPATTRRGLSVANYDHRVVAPADSSSRGPTRTLQSKPEVAAPGTDIVAACAMGGRPDGHGGIHAVRVGKTGTSMAAPHAAGIIALLFEELPDLSAAQINKLLMATADNPEGSGEFDVAWGFGRINAARAIALVRNPNQPGR